MKTKTFTLAFMAILLLASCEKAVFDEPKDEPKETANLILRIAGFEQIPFDTRSPQDITALCSRINVALYQDGERVKAVNQKADDSDFGTVSLTVEPGTYQFVVLAHSCSSNATTTNIEKITFPNNLITDTFYYYGEVSVGSSTQQEELTLKRCVSMFRFDITDNIPSDVKTMQFYYTGGSSTFSALSGYGSVNSRQTVKFNITSSQQGQPAVFDVYTMLHDEQGTLKMTVTALDAAENVLYQREFNDVPMTRNAITRYSGTFFDGGGAKENGYTFVADGEWDAEYSYTF